MPQQKGTINEYKKLLYKKQYTYLKVLQLRYCGRDSIIQVRNRPYFHYGPFGRTRNKWRWYRHIKHHLDSNSSKKPQVLVLGWIVRENKFAASRQLS